MHVLQYPLPMFYLAPPACAPCQLSPFTSNRALRHPSRVSFSRNLHRILPSTHSPLFVNTPSHYLCLLDLMPLGLDSLTAHRSFSLFFSLFFSFSFVSSRDVFVRAGDCCTLQVFLHSHVKGLLLPGRGSGVHHNFSPYFLHQIDASALR